jgi:hypothetical protein
MKTESDIVTTTTNTQIRKRLIQAIDEDWLVELDTQHESLSGYEVAVVGASFVVVERESIDDSRVIQFSDILSVDFV